MNQLIEQPWFWPAVIVVVVLPVVLVALTEVHQYLVRRRSSYARPILLLRNYVIPACALFLLVDEVERANVESTWSRVIATVFGFLVMLFVLSGVNAVVFGKARTGSWRERLPTIFIDLGRLVLIVIGIAVLFSWVWGANIGGLFAALGVTSIVIGLAVQNAVGPVIAGLLLLFEQPFRIGDWLDTAAAKGRVVEVNWRSAHIDTGNGIKVVPNAMLATGAFTNLSRTVGDVYYAIATLTFSADDPPGAVKRVLTAVADALPAKRPDAATKVAALGEAAYKVSVPVASPADEGATRNLLIHRAWYAASRAGLHLDGADPAPHDVDSIAEALGAITGMLHLDDEALATMSTNGQRLLYAEGEVIQDIGGVPDAVGFIADGSVTMVVRIDDGSQISIGELEAGDYIGTTALTRQRVLAGVVALTDTTIISVPRDAMTSIVKANPRLARSLGDAIEFRRNAASAALAEASRALP